MKRPKALGKGLKALLPISEGNDALTGTKYFICPLEAISPNPYQPRKVINEDGLEQLADSIKEKGVLQPLVVRKTDEDDERFELIAGERRWRASQLAGLNEVPVILKEDVSRVDRLELAIIENIQRQNLNPLEEAEAYHRLFKEFGLTQEKIAKKVGKDRSTVANFLRILHLPQFVKDELASGNLTLGHARVLVSIEDEDDLKELTNQIISQGFSVRQTEAFVKKIKKNKAGIQQQKRGKRKKSEEIPESYCKALTHDLVRYLGTNCRIVQQGARGKVEIEYYSIDDLERLVDVLITR